MESISEASHHSSPMQTTTYNAGDSSVENKPGSDGKHNKIKTSAITYLK
jgi:hypothetical protein